MKFATKKRCQNLLLFFLCLGIFFFFANLFYNQEEETFVQAEETKTRLLCGKEIPSGEAIEKTGELLFALIKELSAINENAYQEIEIAKEMIESAGECNVEECQPVDCGSYTEDHSYFCYADGSPCDPLLDPLLCTETCYYTDTHCYSPQVCTSPWNYQTYYRACPQAEIEDEFTEIEEFYRKIQTSKKEIWALIDGTDGEVDRRESLCEKVNEDIRTPTDNLGCLEGVNPKIKKTEVIARKLNKARAEFDQCYIPPADWEKMTRGEISGKVLMSCEMVMGQNLPRETKTIKDVEGKQIPVCTSLHNYFCCH